LIFIKYKRLLLVSISMIVRRVQPEDAGPTSEILNSAVRSGNTIITKIFSEEEERAFIERLKDRWIMNVAELKEKVVGFQIVEAQVWPYSNASSHVGEIGTYVHQDYRRQRVGTQLFAQTKEDALKLDYRKFTGRIRADNQGAIAYYLNLSFNIIGSKEHEYIFDDQLINQVIIEKHLNRF